MTLSITTIRITTFSITRQIIMTHSIMTLSIKTFSITTLSIDTFSITALRIKTFSITMIRIMTFSIRRLSIMAFNVLLLCWVSRLFKSYAVCHYSKCRYADCRGAAHFTSKTSRLPFLQCRDFISNNVCPALQRKGVFTRQVQNVNTSFSLQHTNRPNKHECLFVTDKPFQWHSCLLGPFKS
jgi:hypothetical protein